MPVLKSKTLVTAGTSSTTTSTDGLLDMEVGCSGIGHRIHYDLGSDLVYTTTVGSAHNPVEIRKAAQIWVEAVGEDCYYEIFN